MTKKGFKEEKKPTASQLERRLMNAVVHIDKTKDTQSIYFSDKGLRITVDKEYAIIETGFHRHIFTSFTSAGLSRPYLYTKRFLEAALEHEKEIVTENGYSYERLFAVLKEDEENKVKYNIAQYVDWWLFNIYAPLYSIGESEAETFLVYESFIHNLARQNVILEEKTDDMTNIQFLDRVQKMEKDFTANIDESVIFKKLTDEELVKSEIEAVQEQEADEAMKGGGNAN